MVQNQGNDLAGNAQVLPTERGRGEPGVARPNSLGWQNRSHAGKDRAVRSVRVSHRLTLTLYGSGGAFSSSDSSSERKNSSKSSLSASDRSTFLRFSRSR